MRTAADRFAPSSVIDDGWRDLITSAPPPPPAPPREAVARATVPGDVQTDRHGCVARIQFGSEPERPSFDASDRRMWLVAGTLMGLATLVLLLLGVLTFSPSSPQSSTAVQVVAATPLHAPPVATPASETPPTVVAVGSARPLIAQHALRHSKHARKHKKLASR